MTCAPGMSVANTAVPEASAAFSMRTSAGAPSATTIAYRVDREQLAERLEEIGLLDAARWAIS